MQLTPHLHFNGRCEEAFNFYAQCLGGEIVTMLTHAGSPMADQVPAEWGSKILHATLSIGDQELTGCDVPPDSYQEPQGFAVTIGLADEAEAERIFRSLAEGGTVDLPLQETFWAKRFGMVVDRYGIHWMVNCGKTP